MSLDELLHTWRTEPSIAANIATWRTFPARPARAMPFPDGLHPALADALRAGGIRALYTHQVQAWNQAQSGQNLVVVTGTASGKTLCYTLPVLDCLIRDPAARALYLFPTKALAQDQLHALKTLVAHLPSAIHIPAATYDGDTASGARPTVRKTARVVISNPDMLHTGILPRHTAWAEFLAHLRYVVIDEMHGYRGVFGSHVANVLRRLKRVMLFYGARPQFVLTSATIANPVELAERLIEAPVALVDDDGAPKGEKHFLLYNPPILDPALVLRRSALLESVRLAGDLLSSDVQTVVFARTRRSVELLLNTLRANHPDHQSAIRGYRSGYLPRQRREIEDGLRKGTVRVVSATNALELGIDIGGMGAAILSGYPGTIAGTWQQAGRAGRVGTEEGQASASSPASLAVLVASANPIDQFLVRHPDYFFDRSPEQALINPDNPLILLAHLRCAAFEMPFGKSEGFGRVPPAQVAEFLDFMHVEGALRLSGDRYFWADQQYPAGHVSLRSASARTVVLQAEEEGRTFTVGEVDGESAPWMVHPGAIYLHEGASYLVQGLDLQNGLAQLAPAQTDYYTQPRTETTVQLVQGLAQAPACGATKAHGEILVISRVIGFRKVRWFTQEQLGVEELDLPPTQLQTTGYWLSLAEETVERLREQGVWSNDPNDYGLNWPVQRDLARARDGYRCHVCGAAEAGRAHDVHHQVPFRTFESYLQANQLSNLITLCSACHRRVEQAVHVRSGLAGLAFVLGHLAPLFLMCDIGDIGIHSDPQSPLADGRPTVVIYDQVPAGIGFSERLFVLHDELVGRALELVRECPCADGCPSCVGPAGERGIGGKQETLALLNAMADRDLSR